MGLKFGKLPQKWESWQPEYPNQYTSGKPPYWEQSKWPTNRENELKEFNDGRVEEIVSCESVVNESFSDGPQQVTLDDVTVVEVVF